MKDEELEKMMLEHEAYEKRIKTLLAMTIDARAQLAESFLQVGHASTCYVEISVPELDVISSAHAIGVSTEPVDTRALADLAARATHAKVARSDSAWCVFP